MNRQRGQGAAENSQRGQSAAGVNPQRSHNNGANRQHGLNAGMSQNKHKHNNSRVRDRNTQTKRFFFRRTEKSRQLRDENRPFSDLQPKPENTYDKPHKTDERLEGVSSSFSSLTTIDPSLTPQNIPVVLSGCPLIINHNQHNKWCRETRGSITTI